MGTLVKRKHSFCPFIWVALEQELCLPSRSEYIRILVSSLGLPSEYDYWLREYSPNIPLKSTTTTAHTDETQMSAYIGSDSELLGELWDTDTCLDWCCNSKGSSRTNCEGWEANQYNLVWLCDGCSMPVLNALLPFLDKYWFYWQHGKHWR